MFAFIQLKYDEESPVSRALAVEALQPSILRCTLQDFWFLDLKIP